MSSPATAAPVCQFRVRREVFCGIEAIRLTDDAGEAHAVIALRGATLLDWRVATDDGVLALTDGYASADEMDSQDGVRNGVMAPFQNRIAEARYSFDGVDYDLMPGVPPEQRLTYHGFARTLDFRPVRADECADNASVLFVCDALRGGGLPGYPFAVSMQVRISLSRSGLSLEIAVSNVGDRDAPVSLGWHPYFCLGAPTIDTLELQVPAAALVVTDDALIPLPGEAACAPLTSRPECDFSTYRAIDATQLDCCYASLRTTRGGIINSILRDPASGHALRVWQRGGLVHVFTGDTLARDERRAIAIEPVDAPTNAFNRSDCDAAIRLPAGATRSFSCGVDFVHATPSHKFRPIAK